MNRTDVTTGSFTIPASSISFTGPLDTMPEAHREIFTELDAIVDELKRLQPEHADHAGWSSELTDGRILCGCGGVLYDTIIVQNAMNAAGGAG